MAARFYYIRVCDVVAVSMMLEVEVVFEVVAEEVALFG